MVWQTRLACRAAATDDSVMTLPTDDVPPSDALPKVDLALCVDPYSLRRFRAVLRYLCVGLLDAAAKVRLVTSSPDVESVMLGSVQHVFHRELCWPLRRRRLRHVLETLAARPPNIVHGLSERSFDLAGEAARHFDAHLILHAMDLRDVDALARPGGHPVDRVMAGSQPIFDAFIESGAVEPDRVVLVRPGIVAGDGATCFTQPQRIPTILCTSQLIPANGVDRLLEALRLLRASGHDFMAFLTGSGSMEHELRRTAQRSGLASVVTFAEPLGEAQQIMVGADLFVRPAVEGALSVRSLQAMGVGMALVTVQGGAGDAYAHEHTVLACPDAQPTTLAAALERLLNDRPFARTLATQAIQHIKKHHSISAMCEKVLQVYYDLSLRDKTLSVGG